MRAISRACVALTAVLAAATLTSTADARGLHGGGFGGHGGHMGGGHIGYVGHNGHGYHGHGHYHGGWGPRVGLGFYGPAYGYYDSYYADDCYRVYTRGRYRTICD